MIDYKCPECGADMESPDQLEGGTDFCPECGSAVEVPSDWLDESLDENEEGQGFGEGEGQPEVEDGMLPFPEDGPSKWYEPLLGGLGCLLPIAGLVVCVLLLYFAAWLAPKILPWLVLASWLALAVTVLVLLPLSLIRDTRVAGAIGMVAASYVFGVTLWFSGFFLAYAIWGIWGVIIGMALFGVGVVPIAMFATLLNGMWGDLLALVILLVLVWGTRILGAWATAKVEAETD